MDLWRKTLASHPFSFVLRFPTVYTGLMGKKIANLYPGEVVRDQTGEMISNLTWERDIDTVF